MKKNKYNWVVFGLIGVALVVVAYALWQNKKGSTTTNDKGGSGLFGGSSGGSNTNSGGSSTNTALNENTPVGTLKKATDAYTIKYIQNAINNSINYLKPLMNDPSVLPATLVVDGDFGAKTTAALNYLYAEFFQVQNASTKTLSQLRAIIDNSGLQSNIITKIKQSFA